MSNPIACLHRRAGEFLFAATFLTRLPLPVPAATFAAGTSLADTMWAFPLIGGLIGAAGALVLEAARNGFGVALPVAALIAIAAQILLTGSLHEDGLADIADGFGGGRTRERKLEILRDSRIGAYGTLALIIAVGLRWTAAATLPWDGRMAAFVAAGALSRAAIPLAMRLLTPARTDGAGAGAGTPSWPVTLAALALGLLSLVLLKDDMMLPAVVAAALAGFVVCYLAARQIAGYTGDVLGALSQAVEITVLVILSGHS